MSVVNSIFGMVMATRAEIVKVTPFIPFWPNNGKDRAFCQQVHMLGFLCVYTTPSDSYIVHEDVEFRATDNKNALFDCLVCEALLFYLDMKYYDEMMKCLSVRWIEKYGSGNLSLQEIHTFWDDFIHRTSDFLNGNDAAFNELSQSYRNQ